MPEERRYKDSKIYSCFVLNRLVSEMGIDLYQTGLEEKLDEILAERSKPLSKEEIKHEIKSNHYMTEKVIDSLLADELVRMEKEDGRYRISITKKGILHVRKFNEFYKEIYREQIKDHYRFRQMPHWFD
jgi:predicted transcriptional regulator